MGLESLNNLIALGSSVGNLTPPANIVSNKANTYKTTISQTPSGQPAVSKDVIDKVAQNPRPSNVADADINKEAVRISKETVTVQQFKEAYEVVTGKKPDAKLLRRMEQLKNDPFGALQKGGADLAEISTYQGSIGLVTVTVDPSKRAAIDAARATVLNTFNNLAWAATAREQLATSKDQLAVQKEVKTIQQSSLTQQQKSVKISELNLKLAERNEVRQQRALNLQQSSVKLQGDSYLQTKAYNSQVLANQRTQLKLQERSINQTASNANRAYDQSERLSANNIANTNLNAKQNRVFQRATQQETAYNTAKVNWNTERGSTTAYKNQQLIRYDQDGWVIPNAFNESTGQLMSIPERLAILNDRKAATPRPNFAALERQFAKESGVPNAQADDTTKLPSPSEVLPRGTAKESYYSKAELSEHNARLTSALRTNKFAKFLKTASAQYPNGMSKAFQTRLVELCVIANSVSPKATGTPKQAADAAVRMLSLIADKKAPDQNKFISSSNGTVKFYFGDKR